VFRISTDGTGYTNLHNFSGFSDGAGPRAGLILSGNDLYGTTLSGGSSYNGTVFKLDISGTNLALLHSFTATSGALSTNSDGALPFAAGVL
jgi:uncharacterized repeat protein (TIGR03803 family)